MAAATAHRLGASLVALMLWLLSGLALAQDVLPVPPLTGRVIDQTDTLGVAASESMTHKLAGIETKHGSQVVVLIVPTTRPEGIEVYAQRVGDTWKIGRREVGDGLLIVVAKNDRTVRIEVAKALEGAIPDVMARRIIDEQIVPAFRAGNFARGLNDAVDRIERLIAYEGFPPPPAASVGPNASTVIGMIAALPALLALIAYAGWRSRRSTALHIPQRKVPQRILTPSNAREDVDMWTASGGSADSFSAPDSSSAGDSFSSGGGGDFGGGGASGKW